MAWDPGSNNSLAVHDLTLIDRGLLAGHDNTRFSGFLVGRSGFFDFGVPADTQRPSVDTLSPADGAVLSDVNTLEGTATDDRDISSVRIRLRNLDTGQYLQANRTSFGGTVANLPVTLTPTGAGTANWSVPMLIDLPTGQYQVRARSTDTSGQHSIQLDTEFRIGGSASCTVALNASNDPIISWTEFNNVNNVQVRRNGTWKASGTAGSGTYTDTTVTAGSTYNYEIRYRPNGTTTDIACTPTSITIPTNGGGPDTTPPVITLTTTSPQSPGTITLNGTVTDNNSGVDRVRILVQNEQTRQYWNGTTYQSSWIWNVATVNANGTWTLPNVNLNTAGLYEIRMWAWDNENNRSTPISSFLTIQTGGGGGGQTCTATTNPNGTITLNWTAIPGENRYIIRRNNSWLASVTGGALTYTDTLAQPGDTYLIRSDINGTRTNTDCV